METAKLNVQPLELPSSLKDRVYEALKTGILEMDLYGGPGEPRLDERQLSQELGVSRTPIREAIFRLEQEGFVRVEQRKGIFVVRKTKREVLEMIMAWGALEAMAARLITHTATDAEIASLREIFGTLVDDKVRAHIDEYSELNIQFHQKILELSKNQLIIQITDNLFAHMRSIRRKTIGEEDRVERSIIDHMHIIEALEKRDSELAEKRVRQHTLDLAAHVEKNINYLDQGE